MDRRVMDLIDARDPIVERTWRQLEAQAQPSYFLSWGWIENWLATLPTGETPSLAVITTGGEMASAFFLTKRRVRRSLLMSSDTLYFNATSSPHHDELSIEHNGMLAAPGARRSLAGLLELLPGDWDELVLPAIDRYAFDDLGAPASPLTTRYNIEIEREAIAPFVDLDAVRTVEGGYDALLSSSTRTQLRRARDLLGGIDVEVGADEQHAMDIYGELLHLQAERRGAFADPWFESFHRRLIKARLSRGEIQLMRVTSGGATLGCLYNLVYRDHVTSYQCGLASFEDSQLKSGYLCQAAAIEYNALAGHAIYDLVGGRARNKENLATGMNRLVWLRIQRPRERVSVDSLRRWKDRLLGDRAKLTFNPA